MKGYSIRNLLGAAAICFAAQVQAAGPLDGIYQVGSGGEWLSVHQTGNHLTVGRFFDDLGSDVWILANGQKFTTTNVGRWYLMAGDLASPASTSFTITGESNVGACKVTYRIDLGNQIWMEWIAIAQTAAGTQQGIDCQGIYATATNNGVNTWVRLTKIA